MNEWIATPGSSNLAGFRYNETTQTLTVQFNSGTIYDYYDVPPHVFEGMKSADSQGKYLNKEIKGVYRYARQ